MARRLGRPVKFVRPGRYIFNMLVFILAIGAVVFFLSPWGPQRSQLLVEAFEANMALNGIILFVLFIGIIYNLRQAGVISPAVNWVEGFLDTADATRARLPRPPGLIGAMVRPLIDADASGGPLSSETSRAILDSIGTRMDEGRELGRYISNLLVFLGLLGTFWGLLETVNAVGDTIAGLANAGVDAEDTVTQLIENLEKPLGGMGTAFSSSLFGLGGSLIIGFLDLQAGQAQNRFYSSLEDWLSGMTTVSTAGAGTRSSLHGRTDTGDLLAALLSLEGALAANTETQIKSQTGQSTEIKEEIRNLNRTLTRLGNGG